MEYNLFTLEANHLTYDPGHRTAYASGNVLIVNRAGTKQSVESVVLKMEDGLAFAYPVKHGNP